MFWQDFVMNQLPTFYFSQTKTLGTVVHLACKSAVFLFLSIGTRKALKRHIYFIYEKLNPDLKLSPTTVGSLQNDPVVVLGPRKHCNMCWQSCKPNLESLRFNIRIFIRSNACLELFLWVDGKPLAVFLGRAFLVYR